MCTTSIETSLIPYVTCVERIDLITVMILATLIVGVAGLVTLLLWCFIAPDYELDGKAGDKEGDCHE